jgi:predicted DNA repair protein MutK
LLQTKNMASGFFAILDDIAALMDDVAVTAKIATQKTAGILGDDLAVNAEKATGFLESREIPVLMKIMKGSFVNKLIIVPVVFLLQWLYEPAITTILIFGGFYLAFEGVEKIIEYLFHRSKKGHEVIEQANQPVENGADLEKSKIKSAVTTDFILSLEIVIIALASAKVGYEALKSKFDPLLVEIVTVSIVAIIATVGVYGIVALIVRMDDAGYKLIKKSKTESGFLVSLGNFLVNALPWVIKGLGVVGTIALILVAGGIFVHNIEWIHHHFLPNFNSTLREALAGIIGGLIAIPIFKLGTKAISLVKK